MHGTMSKLVIVESPTKAKTIRKLLGAGYTVLSSYGHIRDLPKSDLGVDIEHGYKPKYVIPTSSRTHVKALKEAAKSADEILFATDEDREGEAISWHLAHLLNIDPAHVKRIVFHEITKQAIEEAVANPRLLNQDLVDAQQARRILDRLYGYEISPILWRKVAPKLSAGRVQSVATRLIVERERERMQFIRAPYWGMKGLFAKSTDPFEAVLTHVNEQAVAIGKHFDPKTGALLPKSKDDGVLHLDETQAKALERAWQNDVWTVKDVEEKPSTLHPAPPFTTSTLQQEGSRKLGMSARDTMRTAQALYEKGYITYMRTDSTILSSQALAAAREEIARAHGAEYLPEKPRQFKTKVKNAQEAHEAIRPAGETFQTPASLFGTLTSAEAALYGLIFKHTLASQMLPAKIRKTAVHVTNGHGVFRASGSTIDFPGFLAAYKGDKSIGDEAVLPQVRAGDTVACQSLEATAHETKPPARYTEASLVKTLEQNGIGRPSTFASIIGTIIARAYVRRGGQALVPTFKAFAVTKLLEDHFTHLVDTDFTAQMEDDLDNISLGQKAMVPFLDDFYQGDGHTGLKTLLASEIDPRKVNTFPLGEQDGSPVNLRVGKYGPFLEWGEKTANLPEDMAPDTLTLSRAVEMLEDQAKGPTPLGQDPETGKHVYLLTGRYGPYVQLGEKPEKKEGQKIKKEDKPKMKSLLRGMKPEEVDLETGLKLLALPKELGEHPTLSCPIVADLGRFGPYIKCGEETRSLKTDDSLLDLTLKRAVELLNEPKKGRGRGAKTVLKELGEHEGKKIQLLDGRYGPYISDGKINASLKKDQRPEEITLKSAVEMLEEKKSA
ncbi:MAG: topoisomerase protein [Parcubacteria group bacterium GW2011_GWA2_56_7]|nr:MAG: topoisomerase protein [Parcubacteria group bacterium GW2011_GWA2_56_7]